MIRPLSAFAALTLLAACEVATTGTPGQTAAIDAPAPAAAGQANIVATAEAAGAFGTLITALETADLVGTLSSDGPFTVFAPTDEAFAALPAGALDRLLEPENRAQLVEVLTHHVVPGAVLAGELAGQRQSVGTAAGTTLQIDATRPEVRVGRATVIGADVIATNGVIHVIDAVLLP
ncbi:MAG: fasciclin domain-containing protein [Pseudomonadota bacterium]